jgi:plastocyanin
MESFTGPWHGRQRAAARRGVTWCGAVFLVSVALLERGIGNTRAAPLTPVEIQDFHYLPPTLTVSAGTTVRWTNHDEETHTVTSDTGLFGSAGLELEEGYTYTFTAPGRYSYGCDLHPLMRGTIVVE